ncbi:hypothetical protein M3Y98_00195200 [Aphelenchoides besseyi]|nr:hypothetical protein M3Y98_00195200 [Aphelenchoides besseyi]
MQGRFIAMKFYFCRLGIGQRKCEIRPQSSPTLFVKSISKTLCFHGGFPSAGQKTTHLRANRLRRPWACDRRKQRCYDSDVDMDPNLTTEPLSMVHYEFHPESKRFSRTSKEQLNGYVGQWSSTKFESSDIAEEPHVLMDLDKTAITQMSGLSLTEIQTGNTEPTEKTSSDELDLDDPLQMNDLFRQLYKSSYSIIESREVDLQEICGLLCAS